MEEAWQKLEKLYHAGAKNKRRGKKLKKYTLCQALKKVAEETVELMAEPDNIDEMADIFKALIHAAIIQGWSIEDVEKALLKKIKKRTTGGKK